LITRRMSHLVLAGRSKLFVWGTMTACLYACTHVHMCLCVLIYLFARSRAHTHWLIKL